jgi:hypothetical protein
MRIFNLTKEGELTQYKEEKFQDKHTEYDLEEILEKNPEYFFEKEKILIIGRQVTTNLNTAIDLLGINSLRETVIIELKRERTPRETLAQILEYASFVDNLDYNDLNELFRKYSDDEEIELEDYCNKYFSTNTEKPLSWNKRSVLLIIGELISPGIKQTSLYLRAKGIDIRCLEFKYFINDRKETIFSSDYIVDKEDLLKQEIKTSVSMKTNKNKFMQNINNFGIELFTKIFSFSDENDFIKIIWGQKGFSLNFLDEDKNVALCFCYPANAVFKQSVYTAYEEITKKVNNSEFVNKYYKDELKKLGVFTNAGVNDKWILDREYKNMEIEKYLEIIENLCKIIKDNGWKEL